MTYINLFSFWAIKQKWAGWSRLTEFTFWGSVWKLSRAFEACLDQHWPTVPYFYQQKPADDKQSHVFSVRKAVEGTDWCVSKPLAQSHQQPAATITRKAQIYGNWNSHTSPKKRWKAKQSVLVQEWMFYAWITGFTVRPVYSVNCPSNCSVDAFPSFNAFPAARVNTKFLLSPLAGWAATSPAAAALQQMRQGKKNSCKVLLELFSSHLLVFHTGAPIGCIASPAKKKKKKKKSWNRPKNPGFIAWK